MNAFEKVVDALSAQMPEPAPFGWFHLMFIGLIILATILICVFGRNWEWKRVKWILFGAWLVMFLLEAYKQLVFSWNGTGWDYQWYAFPFQLCSSPLYVLPVLIFSKSEKVRTACAAFMMTFSFFGGLVTVAYPPQVFVGTIGINIQTMVHHGLQIVLGIYLACYFRKKLNIKFYLKGVIVFAILLVVALAMDFIVPEFINESFNMFYISLYEPCTLPLLSDFIYPYVPWPVFLIIYLVGFFVIGLIFHYIYFGIYKLCGIKNKKKVSKSAEGKAEGSVEEFSFDDSKEEKQEEQQGEKQEEKK